MNFHTAGGEDYYESMRREFSKRRNTSRIPPHLSDEELQEWVEYLENEKKDREKRKKKGLYPYGSSKKGKTKLKRSKKIKK